MNIGKLIGQGRTAEIFEVGSDKILKLFRDGIPKKAIEYEYNISKMLSNNSFPVVNTYELITHKNRLGIVYDRVYGITMMKNISIRPWQIYKYAKKFAELHFKIHKHIDGNMITYKQKLIENIKETGILDHSCKEKLIAYINNLPDGNNLCHGDYHPDNILTVNDKYYIIDWMTATKGDCLCDVARTIIMLKYAVIPDEMPKIQKFVINLFRNILLKEYIKNYIKISSSSIEEISMWKLPIAAGRLVEWIPEQEKKILLRYIHEEIKNIENLDNC